MTAADKHEHGSISPLAEAGCPLAADARGNSRIRKGFVERAKGFDWNTAKARFRVLSEQTLVVARRLPAGRLAGGVSGSVRPCPVRSGCRNAATARLALGRTEPAQGGHLTPGCLSPLHAFERLPTV